MNYYRCENPDCGFLAEEEPDVCPQCGGTFFLSVDEEELTGPDWVQLGNRAVDEERPTDALACYQQAAALDDMLGVTNLGWCLEAGIGVPADPRQAVVLYAQAAARDYMPALTNLGYCYAHGIGVARDQLLPGDIIIMSVHGDITRVGHVAIYIGDGKMVHAQSSATGVCVTPVSNYNARYITARRIIY